MRRLLESEIHAFSGCFEEPECDERSYARDVAAQMRVNALEIYPDGRRLFEEMPKILWFQDEPFGGTSHLAQWAVMRAASESGVKVLLDGQGGDELLCGYPGYWGSYLVDLLRQFRLYSALREARAFRKRQLSLHPTVLSNMSRAVLPERMVSQMRIYLKQQNSWINPDFTARHDTTPLYPERFPSALENHMAAYLQTHSLPALLHHEDRNSMAFSIEARLPFLDSRLVSFLFSLPPHLKLRNGMSKFILREAMIGILPETVRTRTDKMGFATPQDRWLRETLRPDLEELFNSKSFEQRPYWDAKKIRKTYKEYCEGKREAGADVWRWICLELWHQALSV